jgi:pyruvate formate lyase activating enzyme
MSEAMTGFTHRSSHGSPTQEKHSLTRRKFLTLCGLGFCAFSGLQGFGFPSPATPQIIRKGLIKTKLSPFFKPLSAGEIQCQLCPKRCRVSRGKRGACRVRENRDGKYYSLVYGNPCAIHLDPIEKKPFFHVLPGTSSFSLARTGRSPRPIPRMFSVTICHRN